MQKGYKRVVAIEELTKDELAHVVGGGLLGDLQKLKAAYCEATEEKRAEECVEDWMWTSGEWVP